MLVYKLVEAIKKAFPDVNVNILENIIREEIPYEMERLGDSYKQGYRTITWHVDDFEQQAQTIEEGKDEKLFDRSKFEEALSRMIDKHDANIGINWDVINVYLYDYCMLDEPED